MTPFEVAFLVTVGLEGNYSNDPHDPGGETKYGIAKKYHPELDIKSLTIGQAQDIYKREYWDLARCDLLPFPLSALVFDASVNLGVEQAVKLLQKTVRSEPDGKIGPFTMAKVHADDPIELISFYMANRAIRYFHDDQFAEYGLGWLKRCFKLMYEVSPWEQKVQL